MSFSFNDNQKRQYRTLSRPSVDSTSLRILNRPVINILNDHLIDYPTPINLNYMWNFGSMAGIFFSGSNFNWYFFSNALYTTC
jgi:hypothetical protein